MQVAVIGMGLIGGSLAIDLKSVGFADRIVGVDTNRLHAATAEGIGLVDEVCSLREAVSDSDLVVLAVPVNVTRDLLPEVLDLIDNQVVTDMCSTKASVVSAAKGHPKRGRFVAAHPMAGTENSGPWAALSHLFEGKAAIICNGEESDADAVKCVEVMFRALNMRLVYMLAEKHDMHVAYVSHMSHVASYALAMTVLEKERDEEQIFNLASGGFASTARLAKSSADMWTPIFLNNAENLGAVLDTFIEKMQAFKRCISEKNEKELDSMIREANTIRRVLVSGGASAETRI